jgi:hypothetical protein
VAANIHIPKSATTDAIAATAASATLLRGEPRDRIRILTA